MEVPMADDPLDPNNEHLLGRNGEVWRKYAIFGWTQERIAKECGVSQARVSQIVNAVRESIPKQTRDEIVTERVEQLKAVVDAVMPEALNGDKDAVSSLIKLQERESKLLGLDSATKTDMSGEIRYEIVGVDTSALK
jgi:predicted transcriptional regulator